MLFRFDDAENERAYVRQERLARIPATRFLAALSIATLISYIGFNPMHFPRDGVLEYNIAAGLFIFVLAAFLGQTFTRFYVEKPWSDIVMFTGMLGAMILLIDALAGQAAITGISHFGMAVINLGILVVFASIGFVATTRYFLAWAILLVVLYLVFLIQADRTIVNKVYTFTNFLTFFTFACFVNWDIDRRARNMFTANLALAAEQEKTEEMLYNVLPRDVAARLRQGESVADFFSDVTVVFIDIVGFSGLSKKLSPGHLVKMLNSVFQFADDSAQSHGIEKVKTIGDAYLAVAGGHASADEGAQSAIIFARDVVAKIKSYADTTGVDVTVRIGIHTGSVVGGVVGNQRLAYDYWGDTMNIASRIEGAADAGGIAVSETTYYGAKEAFDFSAAELVTLKGVGEIKIYRVIDARD